MRGALKSAALALCERAACKTEGRQRFILSDVLSDAHASEAFSASRVPPTPAVGRIYKLPKSLSRNGPQNGLRNSCRFSWCKKMPVAGFDLASALARHRTSQINALLHISVLCKKIFYAVFVNLKDAYIRLWLSKRPGPPSDVPNQCPATFIFLNNNYI